MVIFFSSKKLSQCLCMIASEKKLTQLHLYYYLVLIRSAIQAPGQLIILIKKTFSVSMCFFVLHTEHNKKDKGC